eukprot:CAMPEP_0176006552 /NCGR_PEP_ID=MMETSP0120_2-20121206/2780_1 /TAXON_ID=160619 /ORGANISM="Kryptoperidinium foliaceum, Strain CCMP 1326" /LENGTH=595 /DNA_ID=CAMNT_0017339293 /DNA_START=320 /DNA_END=2107 /DNA_ORIENTATION=-
MPSRSLLLSAFCTIIHLATASALDCAAQISRNGNETATACDHFQGAEASSYHDWINDKKIEARYTAVTFLPGSDPDHPENGAAVHWKVDEEYVHLAVAVRATGWMGFGIAEAGGMLGTDMALFEAGRPDRIIDAYTTDVRMPQTDDCPSDWDLVSSIIDEEGGFMMIEFKRLLDTGDPQDKKIVDDSATLIPPHRVIAAWGDETEVSYHGMNRARGAIRFYGTGDDKATFDKAMAEQAEGSFIAASFEHEIAADETEYFRTCFSRDDLIAQGVPDTTDLLHIVGFEPLIQEGNDAYVHHFIIFAGSTSGSCEDRINNFVYVWAPGEEGLNFPDNLGEPMFGADGFQIFEIEVHYNNPQRTAGIIDSSGVRIYYTSQPREAEIGILATGDPASFLSGQPVGDGPSHHSFECPGECTSVALADQGGVTVLREYLHMHEAGAMIKNEQIRNGETIRMATVEYFEFYQNGSPSPLQDAFRVQPGDAFKTSCYYNGEGHIFGGGSMEEMCVAYLYYYPRIKIRLEEYNVEFPWYCGHKFQFPPCSTVHESEVLSSTEGFGREFGASRKDECPLPDSSDRLVHSASLAMAFGAATIFLTFV